MPSHFTHLIFTEEAVTAALGEAGNRIIASFGNLLRFGAQGPDFFYHNQRTVPTGLRYGVLTHRHGYGTLVENMTREALRLNLPPQSELAAFILGFATHAPLDRRTHPYIVYRAGWVDPEKPETRRFSKCHPFLERIIDVLVLRERRGQGLSDFDFLSRVRCGKTLPYPVIKTMVKGLNATYPSTAHKSRDRMRIENAYHDAVFFYKLTNHRTPAWRLLAFKKDKRDGFRERRLALFHPVEVPEGSDFLNAKHERWCHPCDENEISHASFMDLYQQALEDAGEAVRAVYDVISRKASPDGLGDRLGNQSLDSGREHCTPRCSDPFPLSEILDEIYRKLEKEMAGRS
jgi:hypothetical protein